MDSRLKDALDFSNYLFSLTKQKELALQKFEENLIFYNNGGTFVITLDLINYCQLLINNNQKQTALIDKNSIPIFINDLPNFFGNLVQQYERAKENYLEEYSKIIKSRSIEQIIGLDE